MVSPQADQPRVKRARRNALRPNSEEIDIIREIGVTYRLSQIEVSNTEVSENNTSEREEVSRETRNNSTNIVNNERLPLPPINSTTATIISAPMPVGSDVSDNDDNDDNDDNKSKEPIEESRG